MSLNEELEQALKPKTQVQKWREEKKQVSSLKEDTKKVAEDVKKFGKREGDEIIIDDGVQKQVIGRVKKGSDSSVLTRRGQIESFWEEQPFYYDKSKIFWLWNLEEKKWELSDEVDFLNSIQEVLGIETISGKARSELVEGFKQIGRMHKPKDMDKSWIQFKDKIYDVRTGKSFDATQAYFATNPIPWSVGESEDTPTIDKLLGEWVGDDWKKTLYELLAYNTTPDKFMQRIFALCGGGANGKGTFIKLNEKFIGKDNCVASEIKYLSENRFETAVLYRKLLCVMGEVAHDDLRNTNQIKKLAGEDQLSFEFKGKTPFTTDNTATAVCLTNSLPITPDKSMGFYRKWMIVDFPNQFTEIKDNLIDDVPDLEFKNLALKSLNILKGLYKNPKFTNEGNFQNRMERYEERSNPILKFVDSHCNEEIGDTLTLRDFANYCNEYLKSTHLRIMTAKQIGRVLRDEGFTVGNRKIAGVSAVVILNLNVNLPLKLL